MKTISRYLLTLVALFAMTMGAWAQESAFYVVGNFTDWSPDEAYKMTLNTSCTTSSEYMLTLDLDADAQFKVVEVASNHEQTWYPQGMGNNFGENGELPRAGKYTVYFRLNADGDEDWFYNVIKIVPYDPSTPDIEVTPGSSANTWTFMMPGSDVVLTPQYAPVAKWVVEGEGDNAKTLLPTPAENIIAGTTDPIINEGTVATSTYGEGDGAKTIDQGTVMYAVTETNTTAPALTAYSDDVPTAAIVEGAVSEPTTRYVWYYIQGADTPAEEEATDKNTFNNSEVCATPLTVVLLPNVFNLVLKPTKANDITVEVNEVDKTLELIHNATENEDTLKAVKMQSDVKLKAKEGYKFRKVEVKKGGGEPVLLTTITAADNSSFISGSRTFGDVATVTITGDYLINDESHGGWYCMGSNLTATISVAAANGANITSVKFYTAGGGSAEDKDAPFEVTTTTVSSSYITTYLNGNSIGSYGVSKIEVYGTK